VERGILIAVSPFLCQILMHLIRFTTVIAIVREALEGEEQEAPQTFGGEVTGKILRDPKGEVQNGLPYGRFFKVDGTEFTLAEIQQITPVEKTALGYKTHREIALQQALASALFTA